MNLQTIESDMLQLTHLILLYLARIGQTVDYSRDMICYYYWFFTF